MSADTRDIVLGALGAAAALWCIGLTAYVLISDARQQKASWIAITRSFSLELSRLGDQMRAGKVQP